MRTRDTQWMRYGLCRDTPDVNFFPERGESLGPAQAVCAQCVVRVRCLEYALQTNQQDGVWGGTSERQRRRMRRTQQRAQKELVLT